MGTELDRSPREAETRALEERLAEWQPPEVLPSPEPRDGWVFRWIRVSSYGESDMRNYSMRLREGWVPCPKSEHPELAALNDFDKKESDQIVVGGLMLCRMPEEMVKKRRKHYQQMARTQVASLDQTLLKDEDSRMPLFVERNSRPNFGSGTK